MSHPPVIITRPSHHLFITSGGLHPYHLIITWTYSRTGALGLVQDWWWTGVAEKKSKKFPPGT
jgi:hypothetical protein